jgi:thiamine pyrophosphate-dependent acetolactate synthase large subunit-like protein
MSGSAERKAGSASHGMMLVPALEVLVNLRRDDQIVITTMGSAREWPKLADHPLDLHYVPSTMGGGPALGLGLALAQPRREVLVISGDGSLLMSLGSLTTIVASGAANLSVVLIDNGVYEVTGGQKTAAAESRTDFAGIARAAGFPSVNQFSDLASWRHSAAQIMDRQGPRFIQLQVQPDYENYHLTAPGPMLPRLTKFRKALGTQ